MDSDKIDAGVLELGDWPGGRSDPTPRPTAVMKSARS